MLKRNKRGVSIMVGYILLVAAVLAMSAVVYTWMKTYVPKDSIQCPEGVSVYAKKINCVDGEIELIIKNNGRFDINGFFIRGTINENQEIGTEDLSKVCVAGSNGGKIALELGVNQESSPFSCDVSGITGNDIYSVEITPYRIEEFNGKMQEVICTNANIMEKVVGGPC